MAKKSKGKAPENAMDYAEHDRTYELFLKFSIWGTVACVILLIAMVFGFYGGGGLIGGTLLFIVLMIAASFAL
ncbi:MAG: aa3-type cytochrome c oxidase subunit IV [Rhizobiaceae bacterium]